MAASPPSIRRSGGDRIIVTAAAPCTNLGAAQDMIHAMQRYHTPSLSPQRDSV
ncbi:hypothetical protein MUK42_19501 [Musa troglodytarum]|uniref:Uncharacterized protein n=1 Tax=Musa troglodytarum TaxID=320322 RepID=A0A9E7K8P7_9LILI|nr:hypothetical protein MUK42_19501 [Musa troglodytarum]